MDLGLKNKVALVTGAGNGIGAAIARALAAEGVHVAVVDINIEAAERVTSQLRERGTAIRCDITDEAQVAAMAESAASLGPVGILVNNAGFTRDTRITKMTLGEWDAVVDVILKGAFLCARALMPAMIEAGWGRIINISSRAHLGNRGQANYSAAKAGLIGFTRALSLENARHGVTVNAVAPGLIDTEMVRALPHYESVRSSVEKNTPIPRMGRPEDVADLVVFLASERASYITGDLMHVSGGRY
ncbi:3-oxoacyl-[acyl-carrier-protein] reductase FabG (plasmid) [Variovorax sp. SRS16]|uniref:SDR family oxidoreductase n=1 Tax=Variovorax sp. SRS16 TaxID=282217 RepID=UPI00131884DB|nr:SDR family NAD(P)-dependent oxidoreductase [Variovorax sp. SRS16]VTU46299.1 3-oxoacyl-[acyl-carrier-protein] reductase FabG [Variovorax sp. SRS16]